MAHGEGRVFQQRRKDGTLKSSRWWIAYFVNGREVRESAGRTAKEASKLLRQRIVQRDSGLVIAPEDTRLTVTDMLDTYEAWLQEQGKRSAGTLRSHLKPVRAAFGDRRARSLRSKDFEWYRSDRLAPRTVGGVERPGKSRQTVDHELGALRAAYSLAKRQERLSRVPFVPMYGAAADNLSGPLADVARFAYFSAWRKGEIVTLQWTQVDRKTREVRLATSKSGHPRTLPLVGELAELVERRWQARQHATPDGPALSRHVFHDGGRPVGDFRKAWRSACEASGAGWLRFHDLRRSGVRNLIRAGVPQSVAMSISGHRTISTFLRYDIASDRDKRDALRAVQEHQEVGSNLRGLREQGGR